MRAGSVSQTADATWALTELTAGHGGSPGLSLGDGRGRQGGAAPSGDRGSAPCLPLQGPVPDQGDRRGPAVPGEQGPGPHPEPHRVLPDEHPRAAPRHLPVSARRERAQPPGEDRRGLGPVQPGQEGRAAGAGRAAEGPVGVAVHMRASGGAGAGIPGPRGGRACGVGGGLLIGGSRARPRCSDGSRAMSLLWSGTCRGGAGQEPESSPGPPVPRPLSSRTPSASSWRSRT